jgi:group I intron endonuclease
MVIYKITNTINDKVYVGQTTRDLHERIASHKYCAGNRTNNLPIYNAMAKYGFDNFTFEEIDNASSIEELNKKEELHIEQLGSLFPNGYNLMSGGQNRLDSEETKKKKSRSRKILLSNKENHPNWGKTSGKAKRVLCLNNNVEYVSARKAAIELDLDPSAIPRVCKNEFSNTKGFRFKYL